MGIDRQSTPSSALLYGIFGPIFRLQSYKHVIYLVLAFPIGFFYGMVLGFSLFLGIGLSVLLVGLLILVVCIFLIRLFTGFERWLSNTLLAVDLEAPEESFEGDGALALVRGYVDAPSTWKGLGFLTLKFWLGIVGVILVFGFSTAFSMLRSLVDRPTGVDLGEANGEPVVWTIETIPEAAIAGVLGAVLALILLHVANLFGYVSGKMAQALLQ